MINRAKLPYNIGDIVEVIIQNSTYKATIVTYCFAPCFNNYNGFYGYSIIIHDNKFEGHSCSNISYDYTGNKIYIKSINGWFVKNNQLKLIKSSKRNIDKLIKI